MKSIKHGSITLSFPLEDGLFQVTAEQLSLKIPTALGTYNTLQEAVLKPLESQVSTPNIRCDLEEIRQKCEALGWDEESILKAFNNKS